MTYNRGETILSDIEVRLNDSEGTQVELTNLEGEYAFSGIPLGGTYHIAPHKKDDWISGLSTLDIILIQKHILGLEVLENPFDLVAADVNGDNSISAIDLVEMRKLILGLTSEVKGNTSWRFIWGGYDWIDFVMGNDLPEYFEIENLEEDRIVDWLGICLLYTSPSPRDRQKSRMPSSA